MFTIALERIFFP